MLCLFLLFFAYTLLFALLFVAHYNLMKILREISSALYTHFVDVLSSALYTHQKLYVEEMK